MPFYTYRQNNSGGGWDYDEDKGISGYVIIEADNASEADFRALNQGLYFDGASEYGPDCECCGDRWYRASDYFGDDKGDAVPSTYGKPVEPTEWTMDWVRFEEESNRETKSMAEDHYEGFVHYLDGRVEGFGKL